MNTDYTTLTSFHQHERELAQLLERRRADAEHAAKELGGSRLALMAHRARLARAARVASAQPAAC